MLLPPDLETLHEFVRGRPPCSFDDEAVEKMMARAKQISAVVRAEQDAKEREKKRSKKGTLLKAFRESSRDRVCHIEAKLNEIGKTTAPLDDPRPEYTLTGDDVEKLAEIEHGRWNIERLLTGWILGDTDDDDLKSRATLIPWRDLSENYKDLDRSAVRAIPEQW